ncbi:hypothetical protein L873DRAFT_1847960 [Choiromyces venosus 120613-1]|uniref:Uncharacterized protein n=1 Tax=Choiromyces venosus 120613-1 TaxID=1336337 RepID=A0A3N4J1M0_9PEZI|nr:hypothetical protein L873DRAFT_1847960 [Choiromyces venosus 120613-1]
MNYSTDIPNTPLVVMTEPQNAVTDRIMPTTSQVSNPVIDPFSCPVEGCSSAFGHTRNPQNSLASHIAYMIKKKKDAVHISTLGLPLKRKQYTAEEALAAKKASQKRCENKPETKLKRKHQERVRQGKKAANAEFGAYWQQPSKVEMTQYVENYVARLEEAERLHPRASYQALTSTNTGII